MDGKAESVRVLETASRIALERNRCVVKPTTPFDGYSDAGKIVKGRLLSKGGETDGTNRNGWGRAEYPSCLCHESAGKSPVADNPKRGRL